jgi:hypothetical protein
MNSLSPATRVVYQENAVFVLRILNSRAEGFDGTSDQQWEPPSGT